MEKPILIYPACDIYVLIDAWIDSLNITFSREIERGDIGKINTDILHTIESRNDHLKLHVV